MQDKKVPFCRIWLIAISVEKSRYSQLITKTVGQASRVGI